MIPTCGLRLKISELSDVANHHWVLISMFLNNHTTHGVCLKNHVTHEKSPPTFQYTGCFTRTLTMVYYLYIYNSHIELGRISSPAYKYAKQLGFISLLMLETNDSLRCHDFFPSERFCCHSTEPASRPRPFHACVGKTNFKECLFIWENHEDIKENL